MQRCCWLRGKKITYRLLCSDWLVGPVPGVRVLQAEDARVHVPRGPETAVVQPLEQRVQAVRRVHKVVERDQGVLPVLVDHRDHVLLEVLLRAQLGLLDGLLTNVDAVVVVRPTRRLQTPVDLLLRTEPDDGADRGPRADFRYRSIIATRK